MVVSSSLLRTLSILRALVVPAALLAPATTASLFKLPVVASSTILIRHFGAREAILAALLWTSEDSDTRTQRRAWLASVWVDAIDVVSIAMCVLEGNLDVLPAGLMGGAAVGLLALGSVGLSQVSQAELSVGEK